MTPKEQSGDPAGVKRRNPKDAVYQIVTPIWDDEMGKRLATVRMYMKMDQKRLGELLGISQQRLSRIECGRVDVEPALTLAKMSAVLGKHFSYVMLRSNWDHYNLNQIRRAYYEATHQKRGYAVKPRYRPLWKQIEEQEKKAGR